MSSLHTDNKYGPGKITKSTASKLFMNAKSLYDSSGKIVNMPRGSKCSPPPLGWLMSEKYDGYRAIWDGSRFVSRQGNPYNAPEWFTRLLPKGVSLDGELYAGRENFQMCGAVRHKVPVTEDWMKIRFQIYDIPSHHDKPFSERYEIMYKIVNDLSTVWKKYKFEIEGLDKIPSPYRFTFHEVVDTEEIMNKYYTNIISKGGEGIMLKCPQSLYEGRRSPYLLKYKPQFDAEAMIIGYNYGTGKYQGVLGSFICAPIKDEMVINDKTKYFALSGMNDHIRKTYKKTHPVGTIITYDYSGLTDDGKPRFARYKRIREDLELKDAPKVIKEDSGKSSKNKKMTVHEAATPKSYNDKNKLISNLNTIMKYELENKETFKARTYGKLVSALEDISGDVIEMRHVDQIGKVKGIGKKMTEKIEQFIKTGTIPLYEKIKVSDKGRQLKDKLSDIYGIGAVKSKELVDKHGIKSIEELREKQDQFLNDKQKIGLKYYEDLLERIPRKETMVHEKYILKVFNAMDCGANVMGSYRRNAPDNGDIDVIVYNNEDNKDKYKAGIEYLKKEGYLVEDLAYGDKKYMGISRLNKLRKNSVIKPKFRRIDIMFSTMKEAPFGLLYFTGSANLNKRMRAIALRMGYSLNEHTIIHMDTKKPVDKDFKTERDIFEFLKMDYIAPDKR